MRSENNAGPSKNSSKPLQEGFALRPRKYTKKEFAYNTFPKTPTFLLLTEGEMRLGKYRHPAKRHEQTFQKKQVGPIVRFVRRRFLVRNPPPGAP